MIYYVDSLVKVTIIQWKRVKVTLKKIEVSKNDNFLQVKVSESDNYFSESDNYNESELVTFFK